MKTLFALFLFLPITLLAQTSLPKGAKKIIVTTQDTANLLDKISRVLYERGYVLKQKDESASFLATEPKLLKNSPSHISIHALIANDSVILSATTTNRLEENGSDVQCCGMRNSIMRIEWNELQAVANQLGTIMIYKKD